MFISSSGNSFACTVEASVSSENRKREVRRIERDVRLGRPVLREILEELHVRSDPERDPRIVRPFDDRAVIDGSVVEAAGREGHRVVSVRL
jgi:hypothetical protein